MKKNIWIIAALGAVGAWWLLSKKAISDKSKLVFKKISFAGGVLHPKFLLDFVIENPTNQEGVISAVSGDVSIDGKVISDFSMFGEQKISAKSSSPFRVEAKPNISLVQLATTKGWLKKGVKYKITGTANLDGIVAPFIYTGSL